MADFKHFHRSFIWFCWAELFLRGVVEWTKMYGRQLNVFAEWEGKRRVYPFVKKKTGNKSF